MKQTVLALSIVLLCNLDFALAQNPVFLQEFTRPITVNPAFSGIRRAAAVGLAYQNQFPGIAGNQVTYDLIFDSRVDPLGGNVGIHAFSQSSDEGAQKHSGYYLNYAKQFPISRSLVFRAGAQVGYFQKFQEQVPIRSYPYVQSAQIRNLDFGAGLLAYSQFWHAGVSVQHLLEPNQSFQTVEESRLPRMVLAHAGYRFDFNKKEPWKKWEVEPNLTMRWQDGFLFWRAGAAVGYGPVVVGLSQQEGDVTGGFLAYRMRRRLRVSYSFENFHSIDNNQVSLATVGASHEVMLVYKFYSRRFLHRKKYRIRELSSLYF